MKKFLGLLLFIIVLSGLYSCSSLKRVEPLFGEQAKYKITSKDLKDASFYLCSGHGGPDPGAIAKVDSYELHEDEYAYDIILRLARNLMMHKANVHIIIQDKNDGIRDDKYLSNDKIETCMDDSIPRSQMKRLQQRVNKIDSLYEKDKEHYKRAIFLHVDSRNEEEKIDVFFYHYKTSEEGKALAMEMSRVFTEKYKKFQPNRLFTGTVSERNLYVIRKTSAPSVFIEIGNIQNSFDRKRIVVSNNRQALANWLTEACIADYNRFKNKE